MHKIDTAEKKINKIERVKTHSILLTTAHGAQQKETGSIKDRKFMQHAKRKILLSKDLLLQTGQNVKKRDFFILWGKG